MAIIDSLRAASHRLVVVQDGRMVESGKTRPMLRGEIAVGGPRQPKVLA
jgi:ABC-type microcin C transport system duplicated ATPase subunit YejF